MAISEHSGETNVPAISGENTAGGDGVVGTGRRGVVGVSDNFQGVFGKSRDNAGVVGESDRMHAVFGITHSTFAGVYGASDAGGSGVAGESKAGRGVHGISETGSGVYAQSKSGRAVEGRSETNYGVTGDSQTFPGVRGTSVEGRGVEGWSTNNAGVWGTSKQGAGVEGASETGDGVNGTGKNGVSAFGSHTGIYAKAPVNAGYFEGNIHVTGNITTAGDLQLFNADCAEDFDIADAGSAEPGTVMVLGEDGSLYPSRQAYDKRVAGVVSGAGDYKPGLVLDRQPSDRVRRPIALLGKVFCKVDAGYGAVEIGDLLTTSETPGHAMKAGDPLSAFGSVIGKALRPLREGQGLIPILIALQ